MSALVSFAIPSGGILNGQGSQLDIGAATSKDTPFANSISFAEAIAEVEAQFEGAQPGIGLDQTDGSIPLPLQAFEDLLNELKLLEDQATAGLGGVLEGSGLPETPLLEALQNAGALPEDISITQIGALSDRLSSFLSGATPQALNAQPIVTVEPNAFASLLNADDTLNAAQNPFQALGDLDSVLVEENTRLSALANRVDTTNLRLTAEQTQVLPENVTLSANNTTSEIGSFSSSGLTALNFQGGQRSNLLLQGATSDASQGGFEIDSEFSLTSSQSSGNQSNSLQQLAAALGATASSEEAAALLNQNGATNPQQQQQQASTQPLQYSSQQFVSNTLPSLQADISRHVAAGNSEFRVRLNPEELGRLDIRLIQQDDGTTTARVIVERPETFDLLNRDLRALERSLQGSGLKLSSEGIDLSFQDKSNNDGNNGFAQNLNSDSSAGEQRQSSADDALADDDQSSGPLLIDDLDIEANPIIAQTIYAQYQPGRLNIEV